jgi:hypothetical protein
MTLKELKILLVLNGNQRIPYAEDEIFSNKSLYTLYLKKVCNEYVIDGSSDLPRLVYLYATDAIKDRWLEAERVITKCSFWSVWYAKDFELDYSKFMNKDMGNIKIILYRGDR